MKIIMNNIESGTHVQISFIAVKRAIRDNIKDGRNNFMGFVINDIYVSVCKNKNSYTTYIGD